MTNDYPLSQESFNRFSKLRAKLFDAIKKALDEDSHCKSYEGKLGIQFPGYFDEEYTVELSCYLIGPSRHYYFSGNTFEEALSKAEKSIYQWIEEEAE